VRSGAGHRSHVDDEHVLFLDIFAVSDINIRVPAILPIYTVALGGVLLYFLGANLVFAVNALCFYVVIFALLQWKGPEAESELPFENFVDSFSTATDMFDIPRRFKWY
jgi:hypothetical protein